MCPKWYAFTHIMNLIWHPNETKWVDKCTKDEELQFFLPAAFYAFDCSSFSDMKGQKKKKKRKKSAASFTC